MIDKRKYVVKISYRLVILFISIMSFSLISNASVIIGGTRFVYPASEQELTINLKNTSNTTSLIQAWMESEGNNTKNIIPFIITPAMSRIDSKKGQTLRIIYTGEALPQDRESLFYLMILDVPPEPEQKTTQNFLQLALQSRLKVFFRPTSLPGDSSEAPSKVVWMQDGKNLKINNPTPYFITFQSITYESKKQKKYTGKGVMVSPLSSVNYMVDESLSHSGIISYTTINDFGAKVDGKAYVR